MNVKCPHCGFSNTITPPQLEDPAEGQEPQHVVTILCDDVEGGCGKTFDVDMGATTNE